MKTHWIPPFTLTRADLQRAFCGEFVTEAQHSCEPECANCRHLMEQDAQGLEALRRVQPDPSQFVKHEPFDPTAGYRERTRR